MASTFVNDLKRELRLPTALQAMLILVSIGAISAAITSLQVLARPLIENRFALDSVSFPFALGSVERAGSFSNLVGWGYFVNDYRIDSIPWWIVDNFIVLTLTIVFARMLWWGPVAMKAGALANVLEWHFLGNVLDWIIFPNGYMGVRALSLGDIFIYGGIVPCVIVLTMRIAAIPWLIWSAFRKADRSGKAQV